ncbi:DUF937 domain-containing protein [Mycobacterium sp. 1465703.0]|uniref:DUF937 domain-containing protein n=1 Tax=Mycobacterium sp. 1465703.0 TaxID=1834078 RepID=UPI0007FCD348|nr:DUF937 domain-containing protein [Mycobacterium sp. 1465703.0]OBI97512.1 hypothetical protein A5625_05510 [Mycobacterium sp. 1465703.0]
MAGLDDLYAQIPTSEMATRLGVDEGEVNSAVHTLVPALLSGLHQNSQDPAEADRIESASHEARGLLDTDVGADRVDASDGHPAMTTLFGANDTDQVASALAKGGAGNSDMLKQLLPVVLPIVLAYIGKQLSAGSTETAPRTTQAASGGGLGEVLGSILSAGASDKSVGGVLGNVLSGKGGALGDILGGLLGGKR